MTIAQRIRQLRKERGFTQEDFAKFVGVAQPNISIWERGIVEPNMYSFNRLCKALEISMDEFMKGVEIV